MAFRLEQVQKQVQKLILSPQMKQAIHLLQVPLFELQTLAQEELTKNPLLEEDIDDPQDREDYLKTDEEIDDDLGFKKEFDKLAELDDEWKEYYKQTLTVKKHSDEDEEKRRYLESSITKEETLPDHLESQLLLLDLSDDEKHLGNVLIGNIDENGYLQETVENIASQNNSSIETIERILALIQSFHPLGVGARDIQECLLIQINKLGTSTPLLQEIISFHLDAISKKHYQQIAKELDVSVEEVQNIASIISFLEPKPGRMFSEERTEYVIPDVIVKEFEGKYIILLNDDRIPHLRISKLYRNLMQKDEGNTQTKEYVKEKVKAGMWFIKNIQQRQQTIYNIATEIVNTQLEFITNGINHLKPLTMKDVAKKLGIHESTVSRAISSKYIETPQGVFQIKFFFSRGIEMDTGENISSTNVKNRIEELIKSEDPAHPLSDQKIIEILTNDGIPIARRTIAKYRAELKIQPSNLRKR
ncbi:MAG: RNA polymerase factor sigma-54 [Candidatus Ancaeobacter aquaticus]|nr:RNA polymerase factor sigma-54 [Candidatus Ancaeobacter aquaticus]